MHNNFHMCMHSCLQKFMCAIDTHGTCKWIRKQRNKYPRQNAQISNKWKNWWNRNKISQNKKQSKTYSENKHSHNRVSAIFIWKYLFLSVMPANITKSYFYKITYQITYYVLFFCPIRAKTHDIISYLITIYICRFYLLLSPVMVLNFTVSHTFLFSFLAISLCWDGAASFCHSSSTMNINPGAAVCRGKRERNWREWKIFTSWWQKEKKKKDAS